MGSAVDKNTALAMGVGSTKWSKQIITPPGHPAASILQMKPFGSQPLRFIPTVHVVNSDTYQFVKMAEWIWWRPAETAFRIPRWLVHRLSTMRCPTPRRRVKVWLKYAWNTGGTMLDEQLLIYWMFENRIGISKAMLSSTVHLSQMGEPSGWVRDSHHSPR
jgi:hypothetical protein